MSRETLYIYIPSFRYAYRNHYILWNGDPYGNRTRVSAVKGPRPNR